MKVILIGPPGAGKGTQAARAADAIGVPRVSSGDLFRDHQRRDTELGRLARSYMERGVLVPDDVTIKMVMGWVADHEGEGGFLLDGFPRTPGQAEALDQVMADQGGIDRAVNIKVSRAELVRRLAGRLICRNCQTSYHKKFAPPRSEDECDLCGGELYQRDDDRPEAVEKRIQVYMDETAPLVEYYIRSGILREVDGEGAVERVGDAIMDALNAGAGRREPP